MEQVDWSEIRFFRPEEFSEPDVLNPDLIRGLDRARIVAGRPIRITSDYRAGDPGAHGDGDGVDISDNLSGDPVGSRWRFHVVRGLLEAGFNRIGVYDRHIHVDVSEELDPEVMWWGQSQ